MFTNNQKLALSTLISQFDPEQLEGTAARFPSFMQALGEMVKSCQRIYDADEGEIPQGVYTTVGREFRETCKTGDAICTCLNSYADAVCNAGLVEGLKRKGVTAGWYDR